MHVEMLNVGWLTAPAGVWRRDDDLGRQVRIPVPAYVIETVHERILVDTGLHPDAVANASQRYGEGQSIEAFQRELEASIAEQVDMGTITKVVLTHLHFDHAGGLSLVPAS